MHKKIRVYGGPNKKIFADYKNFTIKTDQDKEYGGDGEYPEPLDLFFASIGTCIGHNVYTFCKQRNINTTDLDISLTLNFSEEKKIVDNIAVNIDPGKEYPSKYINALKNVVNTCSVKKHILNAPNFDINIRE